MRTPDARLFVEVVGASVLHAVVTVVDRRTNGALLQQRLFPLEYTLHDFYQGVPRTVNADVPWPPLTNLD